MEEWQLLELLWQRSDRALPALAAKFGVTLHRLSMNILGSPEDAEECVSDTYLALWNRIPPERPDNLRAYICRVGRNLSLKRLRENRAEKRRGNYVLSLDELEGCLPGPDSQETLDARALGRAIDQFLDTLPKESRVLFLQRY